MIKSNYILISFLMGLMIFVPACSKDGVERATGQSIDSSAVYSKMSARLYFRFSGESYLGGETRVIEENVFERFEETVLKELIAGPVANRDELETLIHSDTKILNIEAVNDVLYVTLSSEFLLHPNSMPQGWAEDILEKEEADNRKKLAIDSIVNTLSGLGDYSKIQVLVDQDNTGVGSRPMVNSMQNDGKEHQLEAVGFNSSNTLTPSTTVRIIMQSVNERNWGRLYKFISNSDSMQQKKPVFESAAIQMNLFDVVYEYGIIDTIVAADGKSAIVFVNMTLADSNGKQYKLTNVPLKLIQEHEIWKIGLDIMVKGFNYDEVSA